MEPDFSGIVSAANIQCTDGRTIMPGAFKHQDGLKVPVVYQHNHTDANQVLGYAILKDKGAEGTWGDVFINKDNPTGLSALSNVRFGALDKFSVWAKDLVERGAMVHSGTIQEVSLVLAGANSGASVYNVLVHGNIDEEDLMVVGGAIVHADVKDAPPVETTPPAETPPAETPTKTIGDVLDTLTDEQELAVNAQIDDIVTEAVTTALTEAELQHGASSQEGTSMTNAFEGGAAVGTATLPSLKHDDVKAILVHGRGGASDQDFQLGMGVESLRKLIRSAPGKELMHADTYGIDNIEVMFPDAQKLAASPKWVDRRQDWVKTWMNGTSHTPFSRVKTMYADITADEARAKGWIKGHQKTEEVFPIFARTTGPTWVIKKQRLDRQDIIDIVDFDVVAWMKAEMRGKLDEEVAIAGLFGDGRPTMVDGKINPDHIKDPGKDNTDGNGIRSVMNDHELYATTYDVPMPVNPTSSDYNVLLDAITEAGEHYMGSGNKTAFMSFKVATKLLTIRSDFDQKRIYRNLDEVAGDMDVTRIQRVPTALFPEGVLAVVLDIADYNYGSNRGGEVTLFDDFDINFNQYHYLIETYLSGALTTPYAAQIFKAVAGGATKVTPVKPGFNTATGVVTIPNLTGVTYTNAEDGTVLVAGAQAPIAEGDVWFIEAKPTDDTFYFGTNDDRVDAWSFERPVATLGD